MLHARVRRLDQFVAVFLEWILTEIMLKSFEHSFRLRELFLCLVEIFRQSVEVERQIAEPIREVLVLADIQAYVVIIDRILDQPIPTCVPVAEIGLAQKLSVRNFNEIVRNSHADAHRLNLVLPLILVWPPDARALSLARRESPGTASRIFAESEPAESA